MRTQNPPRLKACRFDSDLGHHLQRNFFSAAVAALTRLRVGGAWALRAKSLHHSLDATQNIVFANVVNVVERDSNPRISQQMRPEVRKRIKTPQKVLRATSSARVVAASKFWIS
jgi:hypothetical protein